MVGRSGVRAYALEQGLRDLLRYDAVEVLYRSILQRAGRVPERTMDEAIAILSSEDPVEGCPSIDCKTVLEDVGGALAQRYGEDRVSVVGEGGPYMISDPAFRVRPLIIRAARSFFEDTRPDALKEERDISGRPGSIVVAYSQPANPGEECGFSMAVPRRKSFSVHPEEIFLLYETADMLNEWAREEGSQQEVKIATDPQTGGLQDDVGGTMKIKMLNMYIRTDDARTDD